MLANHHYPDRLDFRLPEFTRVAWASDAARLIWEPRLSRISKAWAETEWRSVIAGVRPCALLRLPKTVLLRNAERWLSHGLEVEPLRLEEGARGVYQAMAKPPQSDTPPIVCVGVGRRRDLQKLTSAWDAKDQDRLGSLLGYPLCCRRFFEAVWIRAGSTDTTWPMALNTASPMAERTIEVTGPAGANILWRWLGVRAVPHLPCAFDCQATEAFAQNLKRVGVEAGLGEAFGWIGDILDWPLEWSALHGIAEIKTPVLKISTTSDATADKYVVRRKGATYPEEGSRGLSFPYIPPRHRLVADSRAYRAGLSNPIKESTPIEEWQHRDNGFSSTIAMHRLHAPVVELARQATELVEGKVIDLGCGNGALLAKICEGRGALEPFGIDRNAEAIAHARSIHVERPENFRVADIFDAAAWTGERPFALAILMLGRLLERPPAEAAQLMASLRSSCASLLLYVYPGWSRERFPELLARAGLTSDHVDEGARVALLALH
jgi:hypothetical protein